MTVFSEDSGGKTTFGITTENGESIASVFVLSDRDFESVIKSMDSLEQVPESILYMDTIEVVDKMTTFSIDSEIMQNAKTTVLVTNKTMQVLDMENILNLYVSPDGTSAGDGSMENPFGSIKDAITYASNTQNFNVNIYLLEGTYSITDTTNIEGVYRNIRIIGEKGKVFLSGIKTIESNLIVKCEDETILTQVSPDAAEHLLTVDVSDNFDYFDISAKFSLGEDVRIPPLYMNNQKLTVAKWPDFDYNLIESVVYAGGKKDLKEGLETDGGIISFTEDNPLKWTNIDNIYIDHYGSSDWLREWSSVAEINAENKTITMGEWTRYGFSKNKRWSAVNVLQELNLPGEFYIDKSNKKLYIYSFGDSTDVSYIGLNKTMFNLYNCSGITFEGIDFGYTTARAIQSDEESSNIIIQNCSFHDMATGISISSTDSVVANNDIYNCFDHSIVTGGGDRENLIETGLSIKENHISNGGSYRQGYGYGSALSVSGVGTSIENNIIHGNARGGITIGSSNVLKIINNEIYNVTNSSADAGAIYAGCDWSSYGNEISGNYIHDFYGKSRGLTEGNIGIYMDDWFSGVLIKNNVVAKNTDGAESTGIYIASGRDNKITSNFVVNLKSGLQFLDRYNEGLWIPSERKRPTMGKSLTRVNSNGTPYGEAFPEIAVTLEEYNAAYPEEWRTTEKELDELDSGTQQKIRYFWSNFIKNTVATDNTSYAKQNVIHDVFYTLGQVENNTFNAVPRSVEEVANIISGTLAFQMAGYRDSEFTLNDFKLCYPYDKSVLTSDNVSFLWEKVDFADEYRYEISLDEDFETIIEMGSSIENGVQVKLYAGTYYWRIVAKNTSGYLETEKLSSNILSFTIPEDVGTVGVAPEILNLSVEGNYLVGEKLIPVYDFHDGNGDSEGESVISWWYSFDKNGDFIMFSDDREAVPGSEQVGAYIKCKVIPVSEKYPFYGEEIESEPVKMHKYIAPVSVVASGTTLGLTFKSELLGNFNVFVDGKETEASYFKNHLSIPLEEDCESIVYITNGVQVALYKVKNESVLADSFDNSADGWTGGNFSYNNGQLVINKNSSEMTFPEKWQETLNSLEEYTVEFDILNERPDFRLYAHSSYSLGNGYRYAVRTYDSNNTYWNGIFPINKNNSAMTTAILGAKRDTEYLRYIGNTPPQMPMHIVYGESGNTQFLGVNGQLRLTQDFDLYGKGFITFNTTGSLQDVVIDNVKVYTSTIYDFTSESNANSKCLIDVASVSKAAGNTYEYEIKVCNLTDLPVYGHVIIALYNGSKMTGLKILESVEFTRELIQGSINDTEYADQAKIMVFDSFGNLVPLTEAKAVIIENNL